MAKVSIIIPIYNVEKYLRRNLNSLRLQSYKDIEFLCVNDGSTDNSRDIVLEFVAIDSRFKLLDKTNGGLSDARNFGLKHNNSPLIMFIDSDDFCEEDMVKLCVDKMLAQDLDMVVFDYMQYFGQGDIKELIKLPFDSNVIYNINTHPEIVAFMNNAAWNKMYKASLFSDNQIEYPFGYRHQDLGTTFRLLSQCMKIGYIDKALYNYLADRPSNISQMIDKKLYHIIDMIQINVDYYKQKGIFDTYKEQLMYLATINLNVALRKCVTLNDQKFVNQFIDDSFAMMHKNFAGIKWDKYSPIFDNSDKIYLSKFKLKTYYKYKMLRSKI